MFCKNCGYDLQATSQRTCPECGRHFDPRDRSSFYLNRHWLDYLAWYRFERGPFGYCLIAIMSMFFVVLGDRGGAAPLGIFVAYHLTSGEKPMLNSGVLLSMVVVGTVAYFWHPLGRLSNSLTIPACFVVYMIADTLLKFHSAGTFFYQWQLAYLMIGLLVASATVRFYSVWRIVSCAATLCVMIAFWISMFFSLGPTGDRIGYVESSIPFTAVLLILVLGALRDLLFAPSYFPKFDGT